ncbi:asparaginase [Enorma sp.]|uniref:asparaginase n=1 Tax=Enorma sp. TaxID=1920692 RepID=UPI003AB35799
MKRILLIATGGTIASAEDGRGLSPALSGEELAACVPEVRGLCDLDTLQLMNIDSTNMRPADWLRIARAIADRYADFDGFLVLHGTDTMAYTAAALSYLIPASAKPIVLTGSQRPMTSSFTDAKLNLYQSLLYAIDDLSCDVSIVFGGIAIAGTRARKQRTMSANAFTSVNFPPLAYIRNDRIVRAGAWGSGVPARADEPTPSTEPDAGNISAPAHFDHIDERVAVLKLTPGLNPELFAALKPAYDALVLEIYGLGGIPDYGADEPSFKQAIFDWVGSGRAIVLTTQVPEEGLDLGVYEVGRAYAEHPGILRGGDMTTEAIVAKIMWALAQTRDARELARLFYQPVNHDRLAE